MQGAFVDNTSYNRYLSAAIQTLCPHDMPESETNECPFKFGEFFMPNGQKKY